MTAYLALFEKKLAGCQIREKAKVHKVGQSTFEVAVVVFHASQQGVSELIQIVLKAQLRVPIYTVSVPMNGKMLGCSPPSDAAPAILPPATAASAMPSPATATAPAIRPPATAAAPCLRLPSEIEY